MKSLFVRAVLGILLAVLVAWASGSAVFLFATGGPRADGLDDVLAAQLDIIASEVEHLTPEEREVRIRQLRPLLRGPLHIVEADAAVPADHLRHPLSDGHILVTAPPPGRPSLAPGLVLQGVFILLGASLVAWLLAAPLVRDLRALETAVELLSDDDLSARVPEPPGPVQPLAAQVNRLAARVQALLLGQRDLLRAVSHELRTPLARLRFQVEELAEGADAAQIRAVDDELDEIDALLDELLDWLQAEAPLDALADVDVREIAERSAGRLGGDDVTIEVDVGRLVARSSARDLERIIDNLVANALRYAKQRVHLRAGRGEIGWWLVVEDDGPGFPMNAERLLEPFSTADPSRADGRNGLGLSIVNRIVARHAGRIRLDRSQTLGGALVRVSFPR